MLNRLWQWCEYIFPEREDHKIVRQLAAPELFIHLRPTTNNGIISLLPFNEPSVRALIHEAKFHANPKAWRLLGEVLTEYLKHCPSGTVLLPIPLSGRRRKKRGYNQVAEVVKVSLLNVTHIKLREDILVRARDTQPQTSLKRQERLVNVAGAFGARHVSSLNGQPLIIVDDVATTGATLKAAEASLRPLINFYSSITLLSLAR